jgi:gluconolactonase
MKHWRYIDTINLIFGVMIMNSIGNLTAGEPEIVPASVWQKVADNLNFPEGPAWDGISQLYFSNCRGNWIGRTDGNRTVQFLITEPEKPSFGKTNGLTFYQGFLYACDFGLPAILKISPTGKIEIYADQYGNQPLHRPNDLAFDRNGNLYFSDPINYDCTKPDACVYRVAADDKSVTIAQDSLAFPNGLAFSPDGKFLYVAESACEQVDKFKVLPDGSLADKQIFIHLPGGDPDGLAFDVLGNLYIAHFGGGAVCVVNSQGRLIRKILTPGQKPSNLEFAGDDLKTLYLTETETNALYRLKVEISGLPLPK